ncbi:MAG: hypothetical protein NVV69_08995 [Methyloversatilis sp.]|uniref:DUF7931 domain-containing protein n=1 Tax=unclassified Methyloversatilis TaxID=2639971 RepID=UPI0026004B0B|nr:hypothetical protein [Methyloversatilis sp.]MCR6666130.1 hypothetical protein [Methyloversatilis sp.]
MTEETGVFRFDDRAGYQAAIGALIAQIDRSLDIFDTDLRATALDSRLAVDALTRALAQSPRAAVRIVLLDAGPLQHHMPRLWALCAAQSHRLHIRQLPRTLRHLSETFMLNGSADAVIRTHHAHWRGKHVRADAAEIAGYSGRFAEIWDNCSCCISTTKLGL